VALIQVRQSRPRQREESTLDKILKGVQAASLITGTVINIADLRLKTKRIGLSQKELAIKEQEAAVDLFTKFNVVPEGTPGALVIGEDSFLPKAPKLSFKDTATALEIGGKVVEPGDDAPPFSFRSEFGPTIGITPSDLTEKARQVAEQKADQARLVKARASKLTAEAKKATRIEKFGKPANDKQTTLIRDYDKGIDDLLVLTKTLETLKPEFIGPVVGRTPSIAQQSLIRPSEATFLGRLGRFFARYRKIITGAQASFLELVDLRKNLPNQRDKILVFKAKLKDSLRDLRAMRALEVSSFKSRRIDIRGFDESLADFAEELDPFEFDDLEGSIADVKKFRQKEIDSILNNPENINLLLEILPKREQQ